MQEFPEAIIENMVQRTIRWRVCVESLVKGGWAKTTMGWAWKQSESNELETRRGIQIRDPENVMYNNEAFILINPRN